MDEFSDDSTQKLSKFDSTIAVLMRIDQLWKDAHSHSRMGNMIKWNFDLDRVYTELCSDMNEDDFKKFKEINENIVKSRDRKAVLYNVLLEKEVFLRKLQQKQGKGIGYQQTAEEYMND